VIAPSASRAIFRSLSILSLSVITVAIVAGMRVAGYQPCYKLKVKILCVSPDRPSPILSCSDGRFIYLAKGMGG